MITVVSSSAVKPGLATATTGGWLAASSATGPARSARSGCQRATHHPRPVSVSCGSTRPAVTSRIATEYARPEPTDRRAGIAAERIELPERGQRCDGQPLAHHLLLAAGQRHAHHPHRAAVRRGGRPAERRIDDRLQISAVHAPAWLPRHHLAIEPGQLQARRRRGGRAGGHMSSVGVGCASVPALSWVRLSATCRICGILPIRTSERNGFSRWSLESQRRHRAPRRDGIGRRWRRVVRPVSVAGLARRRRGSAHSCRRRSRRRRPRRPPAPTTTTIAPTTTTTTTTIAPTTTAVPVVGDHMVFADGYPLGHISPTGFARVRGRCRVATAPGPCADVVDRQLRRLAVQRAGTAARPARDVADVPDRGAASCRRQRRATRALGRVAELATAARDSRAGSAGRSCRHRASCNWSPPTTVCNRRRRRRRGARCWST